MATIHKQIINRYVDYGWKTKGFMKAIKKRLSMRPWNENYCECNSCEESETCDRYANGGICDINENLEAFDNICLIPDCYRIKIERWNWPVLVIECLEVCITNDISENKLAQYENIWWILDGGDRCHFRLFRVDRFGIVSTILDKMPLAIKRIEEKNGSFLCEDTRNELIRIAG